MRWLIAFSIAASLVFAIAWQSHRLLAEPEPSSRSSTTNASLDPSGDGQLIVHEWGTFTTFSGSDGVFMDFRPLAVEHSDLPNYVLDRGAYSSIPVLTKSRLWGRVRMETPVTYFYTDRVRTVEVRVDFPAGLLTEFYPPVKEMLPAIDQANVFGRGEAIGNSSLNWGKVDLIPVAQLVPNVSDPALHDRLTQDMLKRLLPSGANEQHYAEARATDSALVHVRGRSGLYANEQGFFEKFLFYRGVGRFQLPVSAKFNSSSLAITNDANLPLHSAILIDVSDGTVKAASLESVDSGQTVSFATPTKVTEQQLAGLVEKALVDEGLYKKEAASMVKTWQQSWFTEEGVRILYVVPAPITDKLLPLHVTPQPDQTLRVLVGRLEIMSPDAEQQMIQAVAQSAQQRQKHHQGQARTSKKIPYAIPANIRDFGRMAEPALVRVTKITRDPVVRIEAQSLIRQFRK